MRSFPVRAAAALLLSSSLASGAKQEPRQSCTVKSSSTGSFFDLNPISIPNPGKNPGKNARTESWHASGYDYGSNFTLNFCAPVVEELDRVVDVDRDDWEDIAAYYEQDGRIYSIGYGVYTNYLSPAQFEQGITLKLSKNDSPVLRGRKLVLNYTGGSLCDTENGDYRHSVNLASGHQSSKSRNSTKGKGKDSNDEDDGDDNKDNDRDDDEDDDRDDDDDDDDWPPRKGSRHQPRKSTVISFLCDRDPLKADAVVAFVASSPDECTYFFEVRSLAACGGSESSKSGLGPGGVFGIIVIIALSVYLVGGCVYQRTVMHQRGWRQIPNYSFWASIFGFIQDIFIIAFSSCARLLPSRRGYTRISANGNTRGRGSNSEDENRLIDQLDEEWDD
ncbi:MAG: Cation-independent mannose-6-phosphate receptor CI-MPR [Bathelium mastoideum]|nr:MAG: Cation-independent mannose-6-phosphate receptor CI-MPR [Bathelium mastoideum]